MSSTEGRPEGEAEIERFFDDFLLPMSIAARNCGEAAFPAGPDPRLDSYWALRAQPSMRAEDFLAPSCLDVGELAGCLREHWTRAGQNELADLAPRFAELARIARSSEQQDAEVSPFIYTMF